MDDHRVVLAQLFASKGKYLSAMKIYERILSTAEPAEQGKLCFNLAQLMVQQAKASEGDQVQGKEYWHLKAIEVLQRVVQHGPLPEAHLNLSGLYLKARRPELASTHAQAGLDEIIQQQQPCSQQLRLQLLTNLNISLRQLDRRPEAVQATWQHIGIDYDPQSLKEHVLTHSSAPSSQQLTVVCVKYGSKYPAHYVNHLHRMIAQHWQPTGSLQTFRVVCLTDDASGLSEDVEVSPLLSGDSYAQAQAQSLSPSQSPSAVAGWWRKIEVFRTASYHPSGWVLYIDLDTVIAGYSISHLLEAVLQAHGQQQAPATIHFLDAACFANEGRPRGINSSMMLFAGSAYDFLFTFFSTHAHRLTAAVHKFDHFLEMMLGDLFSDSAAVGDCLAGCLQDYSSLQQVIMDVPSYMSSASVPVKGIVCFPLKPKPHELDSEHVLRMLWEGREAKPADQVQPSNHTSTSQPGVSCRCGCVPVNMMSLFQMAELRAKRKLELAAQNSPG